MCCQMQKAFITTKDTAKFICPHCQRFKIVDVTNYVHIDRKIKVNVKCPCGNEFKSILEKRVQYRKETNLVGMFRHMDGRKEVGCGLITVCDLSTTGMKLKVDDDFKFSLDDNLVIEFHLDDNHRSLIKKRVIVRNINYPYVGTEFSSTEILDKALGFYLFN